MNVLSTLLLFAAGLALVIFFAEKLVSSVVGTAAGFRVSAFWISVVLIGFDPENLAVGASGSYEDAAGIALGSVIGAAMVAIALALGITAIIVPLKFEKVPRRILAFPVVAVAIAWGLMWDGALTRSDGVLLLSAYVAAVVYLMRLNRQGVDIKAHGEVSETLEKAESINRWKSLGLFICSLALIVAGSEMLVHASKRIVSNFGWSETAFGMTALALAVSVEEIARELPSAIKKRPDITYGNVLGSVLAFFLFNAGIIALVRPVPVNVVTREFYLPVCAGTILFTSIVMMNRRIPRWAGAVLVLVYAAFALGEVTLGGLLPS